VLEGAPVEAPVDVAADEVVLEGALGEAPNESEKPS
jgi:hypothetical protein